MTVDPNIDRLSITDKNKSNILVLFNCEGGGGDADSKNIILKFKLKIYNFLGWEDLNKGI